MKFTTEPAAWIGVAKLAFVCAMAFGLQVSENQLVAIVALLEGVGYLLVRDSTVTVKTIEAAGLKKVDIVATAETMDKAKANVAAEAKATAEAVERNKP